ncbi:hypothetical protein KW782_01355 [Candidatus Parcubacteria bacterium]|nr:hypothetical protein [Candidatus Parcubacteria bacterium]
MTEILAFVALVVLAVGIFLILYGIRMIRELRQLDMMFKMTGEWVKRQMLTTPLYEGEPTYMRTYRVAKDESDEQLGRIAIKVNTAVYCGGSILLGLGLCIAALIWLTQLAAA